MVNCGIMALWKAALSVGLLVRQAHAFNVEYVLLMLVCCVDEG